ncbi:MAG: hypothetical protein AAGF23_25455 [Acidobacteriota bacterium]
MVVTKKLARAFDSLFTEERSAGLERFIIWVAVVGFLVHVSLIFLATHLRPETGVLRFLETNYLAALYTPFSFILFYEVLLLIGSIPQSTTGSIGRQYEIISLIVLRNVFKDIADFESFKIIEEEMDEFIDVLVDMGGSLLMFTLVAVFYHIRRRQKSAPWVDAEPSMDKALVSFIQRKKAVALLLAILLCVLATYNLAKWLFEVYRIAFYGGTPMIDVGTIFYVDLFTVMIFTDVLILLFSMLRSDAYQLVFRNAGFIVSTILIRFSLTIEKPYDVELALLAMVFGILVLLVYGYFHRYARADSESSDEETRG